MRKLFLNPFILFLISVLWFASSCKKENNSTERLADQSQVSHFLDVPAKAPAILQDIAQDLQKREDRHPFITQLSKKQGQPAWSKSIVLRRGVNYSDARTMAEPTGALIPLLLDTTTNKFVNAFIAVQKVDTGFRYKLVGNGDYASYKDDDPNQIKPDDALNVFLAFEKSIFHRKMFKIFDKRLFKDARNKLGALKADTTSPLIVETRITDMTVTDSNVEGYEITFCSSYWTPGGWVTGQGSYSLVEIRSCTTLTVFFMTENDGSGGGLGGGGQEGGGGNPGGGGGNPGDPGGTPPVTGMQILVGPEQNTGNGYAALGQNLIDLCNRVSLGYDQVSWLANNTNERDFFYNQLIDPDYDYACQAATQIVTELYRQGLQNGLANTDTYDQIKMFIPDIENRPNMDPVFWGIIRINAAILQLENPSWPWYKCLYEATKEYLHFTLDLIGAVPVIGEFADLGHSVWYYLEGDKVNAAFSAAQAIPFTGWVALGLKYARKTIEISPGVSKTIHWVVKANNKIHFGSQGDLRKILNIPVGDPRIAHHIIPWQFIDHDIVQEAAKAKNGFHMNDLFNGIPINQAGSHPTYNAKVLVELENIRTDLGANLNPETALAALNNLVQRIRTAINSNPGVNLKDLIF